MPPPRFVPCYLCGQSFGKASLGIHQKQCYVKKMKQWQAAPSSERGPKPVDPETMQSRVQQQLAGRGASPPPRACTTCGENLDPASKFCTECGTPVALASSPRARRTPACGKCGEPLDPASKFCTECGTPVRAGGLGRAPSPPPSHVSHRSAVGGAGRRPGPGAASASMGVDFDMNQMALDMARTTCRFCGRKFDPDRIRRHEEACRVANKKRKVFDSHKHRVENTDMAGNQRSYNREVKRAGAARKPQSNWRDKHREFIQGIRAARQVNTHVARGGDVRDLPPPAPSYNPDYVQCPYCSRRFAPETAERHIPKCKTTMNRPKPPPSSYTPSSSGYGEPSRGYGRPAAGSGRAAASGTRVSSHHAGDYGASSRASRMGGGARQSKPNISSFSPTGRTMGGTRTTATAPLSNRSTGPGAFGGGGDRFAPVPGQNASAARFGGGGASRGGGGIDPRSNVQTTSVLGSGFLAGQTVYR